VSAAAAQAALPRAGAAERLRVALGPVAEHLRRKLVEKRGRWQFAQASKMMKDVPALALALKEHGFDGKFREFLELFPSFRVEGPRGFKMMVCLNE